MAYDPKQGPPAGPNFVPAYQVSGVPYVTSSAGDDLTTTPVEIGFPYATRFFAVTNVGSEPIRVGFSQNGINGDVTKNYLVLSGNTSTPRLELRCKSLFLRTVSGTGAFSLIAGLTGIPYSQFPVLTGTLNNTGSFKGIG
jgi:hypothetical protein